MRLSGPRPFYGCAQLNIPLQFCACSFPVLFGSVPGTFSSLESSLESSDSSARARGFPNTHPPECQHYKTQKNDRLVQKNESSTGTQGALVRIGVKDTDVLNHLVIHASRLNTYALVCTEVRIIMLTRATLMNTAQPMDIGALDTGEGQEGQGQEG